MVLKDGRKIERMFSDIAPKYDFLNRFLSAGVDRSWRKKGIRKLAPGDGIYLDLATGTGDLAMEMRKQSQEAKIIAVDFSMAMLKIAKTKTANHSINIGRGDALALSFPDHTFDGITCAFGIRNFENLEKGLGEMLRVLKPGGKIMALEFTTPTNKVIKAFYLFYFNAMLPIIGRLISGHSEAYSYLPKSALDFPDRKKLAEIFRSVGFKDVAVTPLTFGVCDIAYGIKPEK